jgi:uncharacterized protein (TIGR02391 family)
MLMKDIFPSHEKALQLQPEELAIFFLRHLDQLSKSGERNSLVFQNYVRSSSIDRYAAEQSHEMSKALTEAWIWLQKEGMIAPDPSQDCQLIYITNRGQQFMSLSDISKYLKGKIIPDGALDPVLKSKIHHLFIRGDYDTAVFQAFKEVEVRVRKAAGLPMKSIGVVLMREAFHPENGALTDFTQEPGERQATSDLFAGAIGLFKNPASHRDVNWEDPSECAELIYLANYLLRLVDRHVNLKEKPKANG